MRALAILSLFLTTLAAGQARADALGNAQRAYADVDYAKCRDDATRALAGKGDRPARVDAYRYLGLCLVALNELDAGREAFKRMLAIDKDARLPENLSPRFTSSFREAKGSLVTGPPLAILLAGETVNGGTRNVRLKIVDDLSLVHRIAWRGAAGSTGGPLRVASELELELPAAVDVTVTALDAAGGEVAGILLPAHVEKAPEPPPSAITEPPEEDFPWLAVGGVTAGVVLLAAVGAGGYFALRPPPAVTFKTDVVFGN